MHRRTFFHGLVTASLGISLCRAAPGRSRKKILLRSSWQTKNIGDIAHTPGVLALLQQYLPDVIVQLWPMDVGRGVEAMLRRRFPGLIIVKSAEEVRAAFRECDFLLHGSGPYLVAENDLLRWHRETGKPFGVYGITFSDDEFSPAARQADPKAAFDRTLAIMEKASFVFFRDSVSLELARARGCRCPVMAFGPDGAFGTDLRDEVRAERYLQSEGLEPGRFLCCIPRFRFTPVWTLPGQSGTFNPSRHARNEAMKEHDMGALRKTLIDVLRETDLKVLICPEDETQMAIGRDMLFDRLPASLQPRVSLRREYWLTDEALSTYVQSAGLFGCEQHSPIMCIGNGVPAIVGRWREQTSKGLMWRDIGLAEWLIDFDREEDLQRLPRVVLDLARNPSRARSIVATAQAEVHKHQVRTFEALRSALDV